MPARWEGGPVELARRDAAKAPVKPELRHAVEDWYSPATLSLLEGTPINCLLATFSAGGDAAVEKRQWQLVKEYTRQAHARSVAVLGLVYPGADPAAVAAAAADAQLDGVAPEGEFAGGLDFAERLDRLLRANHSSAVVVPIAPPALLLGTPWPLIAAEGTSPGVGKADSGAVAGPSGGVWLDSNMWLARLFHPGAQRPVWISHRPRAGSPGIYARSIADAEAAGGRWLLTLDDELRAGLLRHTPEALASWHEIASTLAFFESHSEWRNLTPFGNVGIVVDTAGKTSADSAEFVNLVARRRIPYRIVYRSGLAPDTLEGLRALLAFDVVPLQPAERQVLRAFAARGGLVLAGPSWGGAPKEQSYTIVAEGEGEIAVYKENSPSPESVTRDLYDLVPSTDLGVSFFKQPSVLPSVSENQGGTRMLIQLVNYATEPAGPMDLWVEGRWSTARFFAPDAAPSDLPVRQSGGRSEITVPKLGVYGAVMCSRSESPAGRQGN